ncbi:TrmB family transcriptional regulator [Haloterrigena alkaliphila]|uniref:TrmB family transcriptional regulator n=1 Tax=Haloterrigena alkaliphila TaxID=2816475 RepID=A0A8A2VF09_9EURY|nr:helix-turn-helix domain-containing protein [Haloterrigena alkaliphila]QSW98895.1 TrmB family transcriptional regulator [Haloterrigena alkaliphila]
MPTEEQAVGLLTELGLTEYEARCFVALSRVATATASEIATLSDVPRSRVYDAVDRLHRRGLVDVQQSEPREYRAISKNAALEALREQYESTIASADEALSGLRQSNDLEEKGAWAIADHEHVSNRINEFLDDVEEEIYVLLAEGDVLETQLLEALAAASDRGVDVIVESGTEDTEERVASAVPDATVAVTDLAADSSTLETKRFSRIVMVDRRSVLLGAVTEQPRPGQVEETAIWAKGPDHGLVVGLRHILGARIDAEDVFG